MFQIPPAARALLLMLPLLAAGCAEPSDAPAAEASPAPAPPASAAPGPPPAAPRTAASDSVVVLFFGDSLTAGYGLANAGTEAYPALVGAALAEAGVPARVVNAGSSGETSAGGLRRVDWVLSRTVPDVFVLALGANDGLRGQSPEAMEANLSAILAKVKAAAPRARLVVAGVATLPNYGADYGARFRAVFPRVAGAAGAEMVPFLLEGVAGVASLNQADQVHPTAAGQRIIAETVGRVVVPVARAAAASKAA